MKVKGFFLAIVALIMTTVGAQAVEVEIDGVFYNANTGGKYAIVISNRSGKKYAGNIVIPSVIVAEGVECSVITIGNSAFNRCNDLNSITIPSSVTSIENSAFSECTNLTSVTISSSVTTIGDKAFSYCKCLTSVTIPSTVTTIGDAVFYGCTSLTTMIIPSSVTSIGGEVFADCTNLASIIVENSNLIYDSREDCNAIIRTSDNTLIAGCSSTIIPNNVTTIGNYAFKGCSGLTSITIPSSVTNIGMAAFEGCRNLSTVIIPSSVVSIGENALAYCSSLNSIIIPSSVTNIGKNAFYKCIGLTSIIIPSSVTRINDYTFADCSRLTSVTIPSSVISIGHHAFEYCEALANITIPEGVTTIGAHAFNECSSLISVTIPSSVTNIGICAFMYCKKLADVYCYAKTAPTTPVSGVAIFLDSDLIYSILHVPVSAIESYRTTYPWSGFGTIVALDGEEPVVEQCAKPTIGYKDGKLTFKSETEGVEFNYEIKDNDVKSGYGGVVDLSVTYIINVYATKEGFKNSETATATLCWIDVDPKKEGITDDEGIVTGVKEQKAIPVLIQSEGNTLTIDGTQPGTPISIYDFSGKLIGSATATEGITKVQTTLSDKVVIVKVGERSIKVAR